MSIEVELRSFDGHNLAVGINELSKTWWGVAGFRLPGVPLQDGRNAILQRFADNFAEHGRRKGNAIMMEELFLFEPLAKNTADLPGKLEEKRLALVYTPDSTGAATLRLEDRTGRAKVILEVALAQAPTAPRPCVGTFGSAVAIQRIRIEFGVDEAGMRRLASR